MTKKKNLLALCISLYMNICKAVKEYDKYTKVTWFYSCEGEEYAAGTMAKNGEIPMIRT